MAGYMCSTCGRVKETADYGESCSCNRGWFDKRYESDEEATDEAAEKRVLAVFARYQRAMQRHGGAGNRGPALGCTVVTQAEANRDIPKLCDTDAPAFRFLSIEPMLEAIDLEQSHFDDWGIDWVICGGESGAGARPIKPEWVRILRDQCQRAAIPFHFKQWGGFTAKAGGKELDGREWCERPTVAFSAAA